MNLRRVTLFQILVFFAILAIIFSVSIFTHFILLKYFPTDFNQNSKPSVEMPISVAASKPVQALSNNSFTTVAGKPVIIQCNKDAEMICNQKLAGVDQEPCLQDHFTEVSADCRKALQLNRDSFFKCTKEIEKYCLNAGYGGGRMQKCLRNHFADLSKECQTRVW